VSVYQGERDIAAENEFLDEFELSGIPPAPKGKPEINVEFNIDTNGIVNVSAVDRASGQAEDITVEGGVGLSEEEIEDMREEAEKYAEQDQQRKELIEARNEAESIAMTAEKLLEGSGGDAIDETLQTDTEVLIDEIETAVADDTATTDQLRELQSELRDILAQYPEEVLEQTDQLLQPVGTTGVADDGPEARDDTRVDVEVEAEGDDGGW